MVIGYKTSIPRNRYEVIAAETEANNKGSNDAKVKSSISTSNTKTIAAIGALKIADMEAAPAQAKSKST